MPKISIRNGVFETNSSSTHSITMCSEKDFDKWVKGEFFFYDYGDKFVKTCEIFKILAEECDYSEDDLRKMDEDSFGELRQDHGFYTYDEYINDEYLETFEKSYTSESGEKIIAFGKYGYDG